MKLVAFDFGTNSLRMQVAVRDGDRLQPVASRLDACRIGRGLRQTGKLSSAGCERALATLRVWLAECARDGITPVGGIATEAVRRAADGAAFLDRVRRETGLAVELIDGAREAELTWRGVTAALPGLPEPVAIIDIGGGSTEIIVSTPAGQTVVALPSGSVVATGCCR